MAVLFAVRYVLVPYPAEALLSEGDMPIAAILTKFSATVPWLAAACAGVLILWTLVLVVQLTVKYSPQGVRNYLPPQIFLVAAVGIVVPGEALAAVLAAWLLVHATRQFVFSLQKGYRFAEVFRAGFYSGLIPLLYAPAALIALVVIPAALSIYRRSGREATVCFIGFLLPVPLAGFAHWAAGDNADFIYRELWRCCFSGGAGGAFENASDFFGSIPVSTIVVAAFVLILVFTAMGWALTHKTGMRKTPYKFMQHVSLMFAVTLASAAVPGSSPMLYVLCAVPAALAVPYAFPGKWSTVSSTVYCLLLATVLVLNLFPVIGIPLP